MAILTPQEGINRYFKTGFQNLIQTQFTPGELTQLFSEEGMMFYVSKQQDTYLIDELDKIYWRVQMKWHNDSLDQIDGIFLRATSENHTFAWIATDPNDRENHYNPCFVYITKDTIKEALVKSEIPEDEHGGCPEIVTIVLKGEKRANSSTSKTICYCIAATILLLTLGYFAKKYLSHPKQPILLPVETPKGSLGGK